MNVSSERRLSSLPRQLGHADLARTAATALLICAALLASACEAGDGVPGDQQDTTAAADTTPVSVTDAGLATPESVLHDEEADVYLVSNINGAPTDKDGNGFIARITPDGTVEELRWIDGAADGVTLHAPKGMAIRGDTLFVSDIDSVRAFDRTTGAYHGARGVPGATFLNDLAAGPDGTLYVSDTGLNPDFSSSGTDAIYRFDGDEAIAITEGEDMGGPNGIVAWDGALAYVTFGAPELRRVDLGDDGDGAGDADGGMADGELVATLPGGQIDGIIRLDDGGFLVSSWETQSVYRVPASGDQAGIEAVVENVPSPADIGWDAQRQRVLIPVFQEDRLMFEPVR